MRDIELAGDVAASVSDFTACVSFIKDCVAPPLAGKLRVWREQKLWRIVVLALARADDCCVGVDLDTTASNRARCTQTVDALSLVP